MSRDPLKDMELLLRSRYGLLVIDTVEEERVPTLLRVLAGRLGVALFQWSRSRGLRRDRSDGAIYGTAEPAQALAHIAAADVPAIYHLESPAAVLRDDVLVEKLRDATHAFRHRAGAIVLSGAELELPESLRRLAAVVPLPAPDADAFRELLEHLLRDLGRSTRVHVEITPDEERRLLDGLRGLTLLEAEKVLTRAIVEDGRLAADDIAHVLEAKRQIVEKEGILQYYPVEETFADVADLAGLKDWLRKRAHGIARPDRAAEYGLDFPKGVLLLGVPGCGKSLCARAIAMEWGLPLLRLDPGSLYDKYIGETERNLRRATQTAERMAPCVLFIDEIEKAFAAGDGGDGGVAQRVLGTFLSWMQDRRADVFTVATANDVTRLLPEFLRKGRFDEIFFVDLPDAAARREIFEVHLRRRGQDPDRFDIDLLVADADGFSGAEIEGAIVAGLYTALAADRPLDAELVRQEIAATRPLSVVMAERIDALRAWARGRTVGAN
jgi:hypothetical protein